MTQDLILLVICAGMGWAGYAMGKPHSRPVLGAMLGFWLGLIGLAILAGINWKWPHKAAEPWTQSTDNGALFGTDDTARLDEPTVPLPVTTE